MPRMMISARTQVLRQLAVVVGHGEIEGIDAGKIVGVEQMLAGNDRRLGRAEIGFEHLHDRLEHMQARHLEFAAAALDFLDQLFLDDGIEDDARRLLHFLQHARKLLLGAHQGMHVLDRAHAGVLHRGRLGHGGEGLAGGVRDQMQMEVAWHLVGHLWKRPEFVDAAKPRALVGGRRRQFINRAAHRKTHRERIFAGPYRGPRSIANALRLPTICTGYAQRQPAQPIHQPFATLRIFCLVALRRGTG